MDVHVKESSYTKSYQSRINMRDIRKQRMFSETMKHLCHGHDVFHEFFLNWIGGMTLAIAKDSKRHEDASPELFLAVSVFRLMPNSQIQEGEKNLSEEELAKRYEKYSGVAVTSEVREYLGGNYDPTQYSWVDMRVRFEKLASLMQVDEKDLTKDLHVLFKENLINDKSSKIISNLFGVSEKAERKPKKDLFDGVIASIDKEQPKTWQDLEQIFLKCAGSNCQTIDDVRVMYFNKGTPPKIFVNIKKANNDKFNPAAIRKHLAKAVSSKYEREYGFNCKEQWMKFFDATIGLYDTGSYSEMINNALASIKSKTSNNIRFVYEQSDERSKLKSENHGSYELLNKYFQSKFNTFESDFVILMSHVGSDIQSLYEDWQNLDPKDKDSLDALIENYANESGYESKRPIPSLLHYLHSIRDQLSVKELVAAISYGKTKSKLEKRKIHPLVKNTPKFNFGEKNKIKGKIFSPEESQIFRQENGFNESGIVWMNLRVLNKKKWEMHHFAFFDKRFYTEVYALADSSTTNFCDYRNSRQGFVLNPVLNEEEIQVIRDAASKGLNVKSIKKAVRLKAAKREKTLPHVKWDKDWNISIDPNGGIVLSNKFGNQTSNNTDSSLSFDLNKTSKDMFTVLKLVEKGSDNSYQFNGKCIQVVENGSIVFPVKLGKGNNVREIDSLNYNGVSPSNIPEWVNERRAFIESYRNYETKDNKGNPVTVDLIPIFDKVIEKNYGLYYFNQRCCELIKKTLKKKSPEQLAEMRKEIIEITKNGKFSILRLSSLTHTSIEMFRVAKSLINSYFNNLINSVGTDDQKKLKVTDEQKMEVDRELFEIRRELETKRSNKQAQKVNCTASQIVKKAISLRGKCEGIVCVGEHLDDMTKSTRKSKTNASLQDWASRRIAKKVAELSNSDGLAFSKVNPMCTSHMNPFVYRNNDHKDLSDKQFKARWDVFSLSQIDEKCFKKLKYFLRGDAENKRKTSEYYRDGMTEALAHYGISVDNFLEMNLDEFIKEITEILKKRQETTLLLPKRGGKLYMATYKVDLEATEITFNNKKYWLSDADVIASVNVGLLWWMFN